MLPLIVPTPLSMSTPMRRYTVLELTLLIVLFVIDTLEPGAVPILCELPLSSLMLIALRLCQSDGVPARDWEPMKVLPSTERPSTKPLAMMPSATKD